MAFYNEDDDGRWAEQTTPAFVSTPSAYASDGVASRPGYGGGNDYYDDHHQPHHSQYQGGGGGGSNDYYAGSGGGGNNGSALPPSMDRYRTTPYAAPGGVRDGYGASEMAGASSFRNDPELSRASTEMYGSAAAAPSMGRSTTYVGGGGLDMHISHATGVARAPQADAQSYNSNGSYSGPGGYGGGGNQQQQQQQQHSQHQYADNYSSSIRRTTSSNPGYDQQQHQYDNPSSSQNHYASAEQAPSIPTTIISTTMSSQNQSASLSTSPPLSSQLSLPNSSSNLPHTQQQPSLSQQTSSQQQSSVSQHRLRRNMLETKPNPIESIPMPPISTVIEANLPRPKISRRYLPYTKVARQPDLARAKVVKNARLKANDADAGQHVMNCPNCRHFLKLPKSAVLVHCPTCSTVSPASSANHEDLGSSQ